MDPLLVLVGGPLALLLLFALFLGWRSPKRGRELVGELRPSKDYERMAEVDDHATDEMLDSINDHRRRRGGRDIGEELADEAMRGTWEERER
jgi:hypothetical protein